MKNRKTKIISMVALVALALTVVTATYAYFQAQTGEGSQTDIKINANTVDTFTFATGSQISFNINQENFASGTGNQSGSTFASALLTANNKTNTATEHYYLYLNIENNSFTYSIDTSTPEIIMTIKDSSGTEVTNISTLNHVIVTGANGTQVSGYDITSKSGVITLFNNREITTTSSKEEKWNITITFVNYDQNQKANAGKSMSAKLMIQSTKIPETIADVCSSGDNLATCLATLSSKSASSLSKIYYHDSNLENGAGDNSYRYAGASSEVNNYLYFSGVTDRFQWGYYRIIGVFNGQVKLITQNFLPDSPLWDNNSSNTWSAATSNALLNGSGFLTYLGDTANKIAKTTWKVGGNTWDNIGMKKASIAYQNEINSPTPGSNSSTGETEYQAKIGLMYVSDYGFAANPVAWKYVLNGYGMTASNGIAVNKQNWLFNDNYEWTITRVSDVARSVFQIHNTGLIRSAPVLDEGFMRPTFYLNSDVTYVSGTGTASDPILVS